MSQFSTDFRGLFSFSVENALCEWKNCFVERNYIDVRALCSLRWVLPRSTRKLIFLASTF